MPTFAAVDLLSFARALFEAGGVPADDAAVVAAGLVGANLCGHDSHGVIRVPQYLQAIADGRLRPGVSLRVEREAAAVIAADGQWGLGQVQAHRLLRLLIPRARSAGVAAGTLRQCGHIGRLGEYAEAATAEGLAFLATVNNHGFGRAVAPPGGTVGRIGTNPLCLGCPAPGDPVVLDIGTSVVAEGKVRVCFNKGVPTPAGWLLDVEGKPTTDPAVLYRDPRGTILPMGGPGSTYKGFGLGLLLDLLVGGLSGGECSHPDIGSRSANAVLFLVLDIDRFAGREHFLAQVRSLTESVRSCPRAPGVDEITLPGDPERRHRAERERAGVPLDDGTWKQLTELAARLGVTAPAG
jgi:uncharacterized oxidoreductase